MVTRTNKFVATEPGKRAVELELIVKAVTTDAWLQASFNGPSNAAITAVEVWADGADTAFEKGCLRAKGRMEIFLPSIDADLSRGIFASSPDLPVGESDVIIYFSFWAGSGTKFIQQKGEKTWVFL